MAACVEAKIASPDTAGPRAGDFSKPWGLQAPATRRGLSAQELKRVANGELESAGPASAEEAAAGDGFGREEAAVDAVGVGALGNQADVAARIAGVGKAAHIHVIK